MTIGFVILAHGPLRRTAQLARALARQGGVVAIHVDKSALREDIAQLELGCRQYPGIEVLQKVRCHWGHWSIVEATLAATRHVLSRWPETTHVCLLSGDSVPLVPLSEMQRRLSDRPDADFIDSVSLDFAEWVRGGLERERLTLFHFCDWRNRRRLFDFSVGLQRALGIRRTPPKNCPIHLGSQWWCLTRRTLEGILEDSRRPALRRFFKYSWIPDESFFQSLVRSHAREVVCEPPVLAEFDAAGRARVFYDDNLNELTQSARLFARKIWCGADKVYDHFLWERKLAYAPRSAPLTAPCRGTAASMSLPPAIPLAFAARVESTKRYTVLVGVNDVFGKLGAWSKAEQNIVHFGRLFAPSGVVGNGLAELPGGLTANATLRDAAPGAFLGNLLRSYGSRRAVFSYHPADNLDLFRAIAADPNADIVSIEAGWVFSRRWRAQRFCDRVSFAALQKRSAEMTSLLHGESVAARVTSMSICHAVSAPASVFRRIETTPATQCKTLSRPDSVSPVQLRSTIQDLRGLRDAGLNPPMLEDLEAALAVVKASSRVTTSALRNVPGSSSLDRLRIG